MKDPVRCYNDEGSTIKEHPCVFERSSIIDYCKQTMTRHYKQKTRCPKCDAPGLIPEFWKFDRKYMLSFAGDDRLNFKTATDIVKKLEEESKKIDVPGDSICVDLTVDDEN